jgi:hypothetical protein
MKDLSELDDTLLQCRELGHAWEWNHDHRVVREGRRVVAIDRTVICLRCKTLRFETLSLSTGERSHTKYDYAEGYLSTQGEGRVLRADVRQEMLGRMFK